MSYRVKLLNSTQVLEFNFSIRLNTFSKKFQFDSTLFESSTRLDAISLKLIRDYDEKIFKKIITHKILLNLIIESHKKLTVLMLITDIDHHEVILSKLWMNKNEILLNMQNNIIVFSNQLNTSISIFQSLLIQSTQVDRDHLHSLQSLRLKSLWCSNNLFEKSHSRFEA